MTDRNPAWERDCDDLWYAARGLAESEVIHAFERTGSPLSGVELRLARYIIAAAASNTLDTLRTAGWLRDEPTIAFEDTGLDAVVVVAKERLS